MIRRDAINTIGVEGFGKFILVVVVKFGEDEFDELEESFLVNVGTVALEDCVF